MTGSCRKDEHVELQSSGYPNDIGRIFLGKCATSGCHNDKSYEVSGGLNLTSWNKLFEGGEGEAVVIPFSAEFSTLMYYVNTYSDLGPSLTPTMPVNRPALSREEVTLLRDWILAGAPDRSGFVKFSDYPDRPKYYITNQGCDNVAVFDAETDLCMRYVKVGKFSNVEVPHMIKVSPDGHYFYVIFSVGFGSQNFLQKFSTSTNQFTDEVNLGLGSWNTFCISPNGKRAYIIDWSANGGPVEVDLESMAVLANAQGLYIQSHGSAINNGTLYITMQAGNGIWKTDTSDIGTLNPVSLDPPNPPNATTGTLNIHEIAFSPDGSKYFVTCQSLSSPEVRIFLTSNDSLLAIIPVGEKPSEMAVANSSPLLFVSCPEDISTFPGKRGSVAVINYSSNTLVTNIYTGHQPHGIAVNDAQRKVYVANINSDLSGPLPHHIGICGGRNGYLTIIDMNTLGLIPGVKTELSIEPYSIAPRD